MVRASVHPVRPWLQPFLARVVSAYVQEHLGVVHEKPKGMCNRGRGLTAGSLNLGLEPELDQKDTSRWNPDIKAVAIGGPVKCQQQHISI
jgi:hypothetical protein